MPKIKESVRIDDSLDQKVPPWRKWGAYVSERAWGTVREDYSGDGDAWNYLTHDMARSKAYRWGEDGIGGWCDFYQTLVFSFALWNGKDQILKERLFGLNPYEGNHGEDVKEYYYYLDATPTHSYMKFLYRYPQNAFPYEQLIEENKKRTTKEREFELIDTGIFANNEFFDLVVEYAKADPEDTCIRVEIFNRSDRDATLSVLPQILFRNRWSWEKQWQKAPEIHEGPFASTFQSLCADPKEIPPPDWISANYPFSTYYLAGDPADELLFTDNESNNERLYGPQSKNQTPYVKDAFHRYLVKGERCVNPAKKGTKACFHYKELHIPANKSRVLRFRLAPKLSKTPLGDVDDVVSSRRKEADEFFNSFQHKSRTAEEKLIQRQALAGLLWSTQYYYYNVKQWLQGDDPNAAPPASRYHIRNTHWRHLHAHNLIVMPDKWEYPWFASWDCSFHAVALSLIDIPYAKHHMGLFLEHQYQHPNGQIPAYEWGFSEANPPVQAWAVWLIYQKEKQDKKKGDFDYLELSFLKLMDNFNWWVNKVDKLGNNVFEGGFLGLDNISIIDRSKPLPGGGFFEESDGTGWMGFYALIMMKMALELAKVKPLFERLAMVYLEHFISIANAIQGTQARPVDMWDEKDGFFYDTLCFPDNQHLRLKVRSFVGMIPFYSIDFFEEEELSQYSHFYKHFQLYIAHFHKLVGRCITEYTVKGKKRYLFSLMTLEQMNRVLQKAWDPEEFLSPYGLRSLSKFHEKNPFAFHDNIVGYEPGESLEKIKGGNSNWRGPIWFPTNYLFVRGLKRLADTVGPDYKVSVQGKDVPLNAMISDLRNRLIDLFRKDQTGQRPIFRDTKGFEDPHWKELIQFFEHYHGDTGRGLGASHQTGWSALVANLIQDMDK
ncbi:MAG: glucosidase [Verrucomicrobia bacterium]|nr:glucosidase [Verrucomicrobiota bacterium]